MSHGIRGYRDGRAVKSLWQQESEVEGRLHHVRQEEEYAGQQAKGGLALATRLYHPDPEFSDEPYKPEPNLRE